MSYQSLLVHLDPTNDGEDRLAVAASLAKRLKTRLIGVTAARSVRAGAGALHDAITGLQRRFEIESRMLRPQWRAAVAEPDVFVAEQARAADLLVVGRPCGARQPQFSLELEPLVMTAGRPLLIVPPNTACLSADRIIVGWKAGRPARLAVQQALPILTTAQEVIVVGIGDDTSQAEVEDVADYLMLHGAMARGLWRPAIGAREVDALIETAVLEGADLIVGGAKCRTQLQERVFGGMTEHLIQHSAVCCLVAA